MTEDNIKGRIWEGYGCRILFLPIDRRPDGGRHAACHVEHAGIDIESHNVTRRAGDSRGLPGHHAGATGDIEDALTMTYCRYCDEVLRPLAHEGGDNIALIGFGSTATELHYMKMSGPLSFVEQYAQEAYQLAKEIGEQKILARSLTHLGLTRQWQGELQASDRHLQASLQISRRRGYKDALVPNLLFLGMQAYWHGQFHRAVQYNHEGVAAAQDIHDGFNELLLLCDLEFSHWGAGHYAQAFQVVQEGIAKARERGHHFNHGRLLNTLGWFQLECGAVAQAMELDRESLELGRMYSPNVEISASINLGFDHAAAGQRDPALSSLEHTLVRVEREAMGPTAGAGG